MKKGIHPKVNTHVKVTCNCGNIFYTTSTLDEIQVEVCSACHPFYTGTEKLIDTEGRVDHFKRRQETAKKIQEIKKQKEKSKTTQNKVRTDKTQTLKEMLIQARKSK